MVRESGGRVYYIYYIMYNMYIIMNYDYILQTNKEKKTSVEENEKNMQGERERERQIKRDKEGG